MQRVQASGHLHALHVGNGFAAGKIDARGFQRRPAVGEIVLNHEVFLFLGVHEGGGVGLARGDDEFRVLKAVLAEHFRHARIRTRRDLIDHRPGEGDLLAQIGGEFRVALGEHFDHVLQLFAVAGAIVHAHQGDGRGARAHAVTQQICQRAHQRTRRMGELGIVALFRDGEAGHL